MHDFISITYVLYGNGITGGQDVPIGTQKSGWEHVVPGRNPTTSHISSVTGSQNTGQKFGQPSIGSTAGMQDLMYAGQAASLPR